MNNMDDKTYLTFAYVELNHHLQKNQKENIQASLSKKVLLPKL